MMYPTDLWLWPRWLLFISQWKWASLPGKQLWMNITQRYSLRRVTPQIIKWCSSVIRSWRPWERVKAVYEKFIESPQYFNASIELFRFEKDRSYDNIFLYDTAVDAELFAEDGEEINDYMEKVKVRKDLLDPAIIKELLKSLVVTKPTNGGTRYPDRVERFLFEVYKSMLHLWDEALIDLKTVKGEETNRLRDFLVGLL
jgi:hypothetical protein